MSYIPALSVIQPWTWLIVNGFKRIENRDWRNGCHKRGQILLHAGLKFEADVHDDLMAWRHPVTGEPAEDLGASYRAAHASGEIYRGGIVGIAEIVDCVTESDDPFFVGRIGIVLANARPLRFQPCKGALGFFDPKIDVDLSVVT